MKTQLLLTHRYDKGLREIRWSNGEEPRVIQEPVAHFYTAEYDEAAGQCIISWWNSADQNGGGTSVFAGTLKQAVEQAHVGLNNWMREVVGVS